MNYELPKHLKQSKKDEKEINETLKPFFRGLKHGMIVTIIFLIGILVWRVIC